MRWFCSLVVAAALSGVCLAQTKSLAIGNHHVELGESRFVAEGISKFAWSPDGEDIAYATKDRIGVFSLQNQDSVPLVKLDPQEEVQEIAWLNVGHEVLVLTRKPLAEGDKPTDVLTVRTIDSRQQTCKELLTLARPRNAGPPEIDVSPSLAFALLGVEEDNHVDYYVLTTGGRITRSADIDEAIKEGKDFCAWSIQGTALFGQPTARVIVSDLIDAGDSGTIRMLVKARLEFAYANLVSEKLGDSFSLVLNNNRVSQPLEQGQEVLECVPGNGALRQIRFNGDYQDQPKRQPRLGLFSQTVPVSLPNNRASADVLWLAAAADAKNPDKGLLIGAGLDKWWMGPDEKLVAFRAHGSLFVRPILLKD